MSAKNPSMCGIKQKYHISDQSVLQSKPYLKNPTAGDGVERLSPCLTCPRL